MKGLPSAYGTRTSIALACSKAICNSTRTSQQKLADSRHSVQMNEELINTLRCGAEELGDGTGT